ncbi:MAG: ATP-binding protein [Acidimicrobiales bacterium]
MTIDSLRSHAPTRSIRTRLTLVGTAILFAGLVLGAFAFDRLLENELLKNLDQNLTTQAIDRANSIAAGLDPTTQLTTAQRETAVAVFDVDGNVLANRGFVNPTQVATVAAGSSSTQAIEIFEAGENEIEHHRLRVVAAETGEIKVVVAAESEVIGRTLSSVRGLLAVGIPLLALTGGAIFWTVVGRSLQPVERLRQDAQSIADIGFEGRVSEPANSDELGRLAATLNDMLDRLDLGAASLRRFVSDASHEIRSPIANIRARVETSGPDEWAEVGPDIVREVERVEAIVTDLTYLARSDEGRLEHKPERIELDEILFSEATRLQQRARVVVDATGIQPIVLIADLGQIRRAIRNLVDNAELHAASTVQLAVSTEPGVVVIDIDDDGSGIPVDDREAVFERFTRLDQSRQRGTGGTGLGLAIVRDIVERHGGTVAISDSPLGGARLTLAFPRNFVV